MNTSGLSRWKLFSPFLFLRLEYAERLTYNLIALLCGVTVVVGFHFLPIKPALIATGGLLVDVQAFVTIIFPFFVAALVAVATFSREGLDDFPTGGQVTLSRWREPVKPLTRRQFVCFIFGYCSSISLLLFVGIVLSRALHPWVIVEFSSYVYPMTLFSLFVVTLLFSHMIIITFWGLYYLTDRLNN